MKSPALHRNDQSRPARRRHRAGRFRPTRRLTIRALAAGTLIAALAPVTTDHAPFDPDFGQEPAAR
jgi:hypothetical protein